MTTPFEDVAQAIEGGGRHLHSKAGSIGPGLRFGFSGPGLHLRYP